jgi:predicted amidohydrolase YtcJ
MNAKTVPDIILHNGRITTLDPKYPEATNLAIKDGRIVAVDDAEEYQRWPATKVIDLQGRRVVPGLNDSHLHVIRGGLNYNMELRWDGVPSLADALRMLKEQAQRTPPGQWVRVVGSWSEFQFAERRMPTLEEINDAAPDTPVFVLHLYCRALLNKAALRACGYTKDTPNPPGGEIQHDSKGNPTGLLIARPNAAILYATLAKGPKLPPEHQMNSTRHFMRELNGSVYQHHRRRRRVPKLSGGLRHHRGAAQAGRDDSARRLQSFHPETEAGEGRLCALDQNDGSWKRRRFLSLQWRRRNARIFGRRFRRLPGAATRSPFVA